MPTSSPATNDSLPPEFGHGITDKKRFITRGDLCYPQPEERLLMHVPARSEQAPLYRGELRLKPAVRLVRKRAKYQIASHKLHQVQPVPRSRQGSIWLEGAAIRLSKHY